MCNVTEYWKSQPKKFCQYCKCWIADNKPSIEFHERGKNHKENVHAKISEIKKKSIDKAKQEESMSKEFAAMEEAALKAYQEDLKRLGADSASSIPASTAIPRQKARKKVSAADSEGAGIWMEGVTDDGHTYYYNTATGESAGEREIGNCTSKSYSSEPQSVSQRYSSEPQTESQRYSSEPQTESQRYSSEPQTESQSKQVDMQLPQVESYPSGPDIPQEPKVKFKERTITSLGDETGEAVVFKKRKLENGKSRNLRQRRTDE
ncbi:UNVERIFIED_CONTAM: hypothetical protein FKN15_018947 [Acipenser sinensis]